MTTCTVCTHRSVRSIDAALLAGDKRATVATRYSVSRDAVGRHARGHLATGAVVPVERSPDRRLDDLDLRLQQLEAILTSVIDDAMRSGKVNTLIAAVRECRQTVETIGKVRGAINDRPQVNILALPAFASVSQRILAALAPWPDARVAVATALSDQHAPGYEPDDQSDPRAEHRGRARVDGPATVAQPLVPALPAHDGELSL